MLQNFRQSIRQNKHSILGLSTVANLANMGNQPKSSWSILQALL